MGYYIIESSHVKCSSQASYYTVEKNPNEVMRLLKINMGMEENTDNPHYVITLFDSFFTETILYLMDENNQQIKSLNITKILKIKTIYKNKSLKNGDNSCFKLKSKMKINSNVWIENYSHKNEQIVLFKNLKWSKIEDFLTNNKLNEIQPDEYIFNNSQIFYGYN